MLEFVKITNLALLESADVEFESGFTVLTGETGAGKSVLLGALAILAGNRAGREVVGAHGEECRVEAQISFGDASAIDAFLAENSLPPCEDSALIISRSIFKSKAGRVSINGAVATLSALAKLGQMWIDFHGANEPQKLFSEKNQLAMLDAYAKNGGETAAYLSVFKKYSETLAEIETLKNTKKLSPDEIEFLRRRIAEIEKLNPTRESVAELEEESKLAEMSSEIVEKASEISSALLSDGGACGALAGANRLAGALAGVSEGAKALAERVNQACIEVADIAQEYERMARGCNLSPAEIEEIRARMSLWLSLRRKYGASADDVLAACAEMKRRIAAQGDTKAEIDRLSFEAEKLLRGLEPLAEAVRKTRRAAADRLAETVRALLLKLGFKRPRFGVELESLPQPSASCQGACSFKFSANAGYEPLELAKIASSGELARVMLAIKTALAEQESTPVLVFDEVDANVGGEIGAEVGAQLANLARAHQVFCVTHLPQVAAMGDNHLVVEKSQTETSTSVSIESLGADRRRRVAELARMLGDRNSSAAADMAKKLLQNKKRNS